MILCVCAREREQERETESHWHSKEVRFIVGMWGEESRVQKSRLARNVLIRNSDGDAM